MIDTNWLSNLKKFDRERFDSLRHLNSERRKEIAAIYSFNLELANIAWNVSEPELGYLKLRWWEDYINDMNDGKFVSDEIVNKLIKNIVSDPQKKGKLIFDGYPRSLSQAKNLDLLLKGSKQKINQMLKISFNYQK